MDDPFYIENVDSSIADVLYMRLLRNMSALTGSVVTAVRQALGLGVYEFSALLGVHVTTVYRWEKATEIAVDPLQRELLEGLRKAIKARGIGKDLGAKVKRSLMAGGSLSALRAVLEAIIPETPP